MTHEQFDQILHAGWWQYHSIINTDDAYLSSFKAAGGKMMTFHGLVTDPFLPIKVSKLANTFLSLRATR